MSFIRDKKVIKIKNMMMVIKIIKNKYKQNNIKQNSYLKQMGKIMLLHQKDISYS